jgi:hypothetical protein
MVRKDLIMEIKTMEYMRRVNLGSYEHEELKVSAAINEKETFETAFKSLKQLVEAALNISQEDKNQLVLPVTSETAKKETVEKAVEAVESPKEEKPVEDKLEDKVEKKEEKKKGRPKSEVTKAPAAETKPAKKAVKETNYDRTLDTHKNLLGQFLDKSYPKWRVAENLKKAGEASKALSGKPFLDADGEILDSFKAEFAKMME